MRADERPRTSHPRPSAVARTDPGRVLRFALIAAWAAFLGWLHVSGQMSRYIGPRTYWVVDLGAVALAAAAVAHLSTLKSSRPRRAGRRDVLGALVLLAPMIAVALAPSASLGALAASHKAISGLTSGSGSTVPVLHDASKGVSVIDIHYASESAEYAAKTGISDGYKVALLGFVTHPSGTPADRFAVTRFFISCCAADAIPYSVEVDPSRAGSSSTMKDNTWLVVKGSLQREDNEYVLQASAVHRTGAPKDPYLY